MRCLLSVLACLLLTTLTVLADWPGWRGPSRDGLSPEKDLPERWSATENVRWKTAVPGAGVSAPVVVGSRLFLTSSSGPSGEELHLYAFDADRGKLLWERRFFGSEPSDGQFPPGGMAVPTPVADDKHLFALYGTGDLVCVDQDGKPVWIRSLAREYGAFRNRWGMAASPLLIGDLLVIQVDHWGKSYLLGIDSATGRNRWKTERDVAVNWTSPVVARTQGRTVILAAGTNRVEGHDAVTGKRLWSLSGLLGQCIPTPVVREDRVWILSGEGYSSLCLRLSATTARVEWKAPSKGCGTPSPLCLGEYYYYAEEAGWAVCLRADSGKPVWRHRLGAKVQASPVAGNGKVYFATVNGTVTVVQPGTEFKALARNQIGESIVASPALARGRLYLRGEKHLFCIGAAR